MSVLMGLPFPFFDILEPLVERGLLVELGLIGRPRKSSAVAAYPAARVLVPIDAGRESATCTSFTHDNLIQPGTAGASLGL